MNDRLPIDILENIFLFYQVHEDVFHPLETLLLVCKFWSRAALSCRALWAKFTIHVGHEPIITMWTARLPLRLARVGPSTLLDISIHSHVGFATLPVENYPEKMFSPSCLVEWCQIADCPCLGKRELFIATALELLAGENGELCKRWRSLHLQLEPWIYRTDPGWIAHKSALLLLGLNYPTPALKILTMEHVSIDDPGPKSSFRMLPFTHAVEELDVHLCRLPWHWWMPNVRRVRILQGISQGHLVLANTGSREHWGMVEDLDLTLKSGTDIRLPSNLPRLTRLTLTGVNLPVNIDACQMPRLEHLILDISEFELSRKLVLQSRQFPFYQIKQLDLRLKNINQSLCTLEDVHSTILEILRSVASSLVVLHSINSIHTFVLKWLWEYQHSLGHSEAHERDTGLHFYQSLLLSTPTWSHELSGKESCGELELLAQERNMLAPSSDWPSMLAILNKDISSFSGSRIFGSRKPL